MFPLADSRCGSDTNSRYDRYLNLNALSQYPNFRWCLRPGCSSGQLYDEDGPLDPQVRCEECTFEMCFNHSMPWHEGQTCEQFDSMRQHGDPEFQQTQDWIAQNTKRCPNCRENIQKGEACFHMTCKCWRRQWVVDSELTSYRLELPFRVLLGMPGGLEPHRSGARHP